MTSSVDAGRGIDWEKITPLDKEAMSRAELISQQSIEALTMLDQFQMLNPDCDLFAHPEKTMALTAVIAVVTPDLCHF